MMQEIAFPGLGLAFEINTVALKLYGIEIYWYGIIMAIGFAAGAFVASREYKRLGGHIDSIMDMFLWLLPVSIVCARLYYVIFNLGDYMSEPAKIFAVREGGLAIYGGVIGGGILVYFFCRSKRMPILRVADCSVLGLVLGQAIGRWGNFINGEAFGTDTALPWRMKITELSASSGEIYRKVVAEAAHPAFLYESVWNLCGFAVLMLFRNKKPFDGALLCLYLLWYGAGRLFIEGLRTDSLMLGMFRASQIVSVSAMVLAIVLYLLLKNKFGGYENGRK